MKYTFYIILGISLWSCRSYFGLYESNLVGEPTLSLSLLSDSTYFIKNYMDRRCNCASTGEGFWESIHGGIVLTDQYHRKNFGIEVSELQDFQNKIARIQITNDNGLKDFPVLMIWHNGTLDTKNYLGPVKYDGLDSLQIAYSASSFRTGPKLYSEMYIPSSSEKMSIEINVNKPILSQYIVLLDSFEYDKANLENVKGGAAFIKVK